MSKHNVTREQLYAVKKYYKNLYKTNIDDFNGIVIEELQLYAHPYSEGNVYIRYKVFELIDGQRTPSIVSMCVDSKGMIGDCFSKGATLKEKVQFEQDLYPIDLSEENVKLV